MSTPSMFYRTLGNTGIVTSVFGFGFWATFGVKSGLLEREGIDAAKKILTVARQGGINLLYVKAIVVSYHLCLRFSLTAWSAQSPQVQNSHTPPYFRFVVFDNYIVTMQKLTAIPTGKLKGYLVQPIKNCVLRIHNCGVGLKLSSQRSYFGVVLDKTREDCLVSILWRVWMLPSKGCNSIMLI